MRNKIIHLLSSKDLKQEDFVRKALNDLEIEFRKMCLSLLVEIEETNINYKSMFSEIACLQHPSWGCWNGFLMGLLKFRRHILNTGSSEEREAIGRTERLTWIASYVEKIEIFDDKTIALCEKITGQFFGKRKKNIKIKQLLSLPIQIRNRVAHDNPVNEKWWDDVGAILCNILKWYEKSELIKKFERIKPIRPWFIQTDDDLWCYNGINIKGLESSVFYVSISGKSMASSDMAGNVMLSFQKLLGYADSQEENFNKLMNKLTPEDIKGFLLGDYMVGEKTGEGGFAEVFKGIQLNTGRKVAIKILKSSTLSETDRARFLQEAEYLSKFDHPNIVKIYEQNEQPWRKSQLYDISKEKWFSEFKKSHGDILTYIVLEWIEGKTLEDVYIEIACNHKNIKGNEITKWFKEASEALIAIHGVNLIHRDITPKNIMLTEDGVIKIMDFGVSRTQFEERTIMTSHGKMLGTEPYMSPEQLRAEIANAEVGTRSDIYSLGATFYELFTGTRLYEHNNKIESVSRATEMKKKGEKPKLPKLIIENMSWEISTILMGCLEPEVVDRYKSAEMLRNDLKHYLNDEPIGYKRPSIGRRIQLGYKRNKSIVNTVAVFSFLIVVLTMIYMNFIIESEKSNRQTLARMYYRQANQDISDGNKRMALPYLAESLRKSKQPYTVAQISSLLQNEAWPVAIKNIPDGTIHNYGQYTVIKDDQDCLNIIHDDGTMIVLEKSKKAKVIDVSADGKYIAGWQNEKIKIWKNDGKELGTAPMEGIPIGFGKDKNWFIYIKNHAYYFFSCESNEDRWMIPNIETSKYYDNFLKDTTNGFSEKDSMVLYNNGKNFACTYGGIIHIYEYDKHEYVEVFKCDLAEFFTAPTENYAATLENKFNEMIGNQNITVRKYLGPGTNKLWISPDRKSLAVMNNGSMVLLDTETGKKLLSNEQFKYHIRDVAFSNDSKQIAIGYGNQYGSNIMDEGGYMSVWDVSLKREIFNTHEYANVPIQSVQFSLDGSLVLAAGLKDQVYVWDVETGQMKCQPIITHTFIENASFTQDNKHIITKLKKSEVNKDSQNDGHMTIWNIPDLVGDHLLFKIDPSIFEVKAFKNGEQLLVRRQQDLYCFDAATGEYLWKFFSGLKGFSYIYSMDTSEDNNKILLGYLEDQDGPKIKGGIQVLSVKGEKMGEPCYFEEDYVKDAIFSPNEDKFLVVCGESFDEGFIQVWDASNIHLKEISPKIYSDNKKRTGFTKAEWTPDGNYIFATDLTENIYLFDKKGNFIDKFFVGNKFDLQILSDFTLTQDGKYLILLMGSKSGFKGEVIVYSIEDIQNKKIVERFSKSFDYTPHQIKVSPDCSKIAVYSYDNALYILDFPTLEELTFPIIGDGNITSFTFDETSNFIVISKDTSGKKKANYGYESKGAFEIWDIIEGKQIMKYIDHSDQMTSVAITDRNELFFASMGGCVYTRWLPLDEGNNDIADFIEILSGYKLSKNGILQKTEALKEEMIHKIPHSNDKWEKLIRSVIE